MFDSIRLDKLNNKYIYSLNDLNKRPNIMYT
jgi:hypothetical protein